MYVCVGQLSSQSNYFTPVTLSASEQATVAQSISANYFPTTIDFAGLDAFLDLQPMGQAFQFVLPDATSLNLTIIKKSDRSESKYAEIKNNGIVDVQNSNIVSYTAIINGDNEQRMYFSTFSSSFSAYIKQSGTNIEILYFPHLTGRPSLFLMLTHTINTTSSGGGCLGIGLDNPKSCNPFLITPLPIERTLELAIEVDFEYYEENNSNIVQVCTNLETIELLTTEVYSDWFNLNIMFIKDPIFIHTTITDPFDSTGDLNVARDEMRALWNFSPERSCFHRDAAYLISGRSYTSQGAAFGSSYPLCYDRPFLPVTGAAAPFDRLSYGVVEAATAMGETATTLIHELGHSLGGRHSDATCPNCCDGTDNEAAVMCPGAVPYDAIKFYAFNQIEIRDYLSELPCLLTEGSSCNVTNGECFVKFEINTNSPFLPGACDNDPTADFEIEICNTICDANTLDADIILDPQRLSFVPAGSSAEFTAFGTVQASAPNLFFAPEECRTFSLQTTLASGYIPGGAAVSLYVSLSDGTNIIPSAFPSISASVTIPSVIAPLNGTVSLSNLIGNGLPFVNTACNSETRTRIELDGTLSINEPNYCFRSMDFILKPGAKISERIK